MATNKFTTRCPDCPGRLFNGAHGLLMHRRLRHPAPGSPRARRLLGIGAPPKKLHTPRTLAPEEEPALSFCPRCGYNQTFLARAAALLKRADRGRK